MTKRHSAIRIALYNHKGGVGKTTLTMNIAAALTERGHSALLVDTDPQCNLTAYLIEDSVLDSLLDESDSERGNTLWTALKPIVDAEGGFTAIKPIPTPTEDMYLLAGDIRLSEFERNIEEFLGDALKRRSRGYRAISALASVVNRAASDVDVDYVFYDTGPNIGPLNEIILMDADFFCCSMRIRSFFAASN